MPSKSTAKKKPLVPFGRKLVLNQWLLSLFKVSSLDELAEHLRNPGLEGLDADGIHRIHHALVAQFPELPELPPQLLLEYDQNIAKHTLLLNERRAGGRDEPIVWKYFQYLTLLFAEIYLDRYFTDSKALLKAINAQIIKFNGTVPAADQVGTFDPTIASWPQINKLACWSATGSGKTLLMHANIMQFQDYLDRHRRSKELNRIILLTPNEGLSRQHVDEFHKSGIEAELFDKDARGLFSSKAIEVLDIHKLADEMGQKTIAVEAFEGNNLVLIDEGHRGASSGLEGTWLRFRNALCEQGFSFEYSATFGQAVKGKAALLELYAKSIFFDYSYRYFYADGFGKDYQILNLDKDTQDSYLEQYMVASLLAFFQQRRLHSLNKSDFDPFRIEQPLWVFIGGKVTATLAAKDASDIIEIILFLARYVANRQASIEAIDRVLNHGLPTAGGKNLVAGRFPHLNGSGLSAAQIYEETLGTVFNAPGGGSFYVENLRGVDGEIALRVGDNEPFGVINVGDDGKLCKLCEDWSDLIVTEREFSESLFHDINEADSAVTILIGSKKFSEGWNSWRVSTLSLMNVGASEGSQIIQMFGRGVRLQGYGFSLMRSSHVDLPEEFRRPRHISLLETLAVCGVHAEYMAQFRDFLREEGLPQNFERIELLLPVLKNLGKRPLKTIRLTNTINGVSTEFGDAFRRVGPVPTLSPPDPTLEPSTEYLQKNQVLVNWYPKIQAVMSEELVGGEAESARHETHLSDRHVAFLDLDRLYLDLLAFKAERGWFNLNIPREAIPALLEDQSWYRLQIPPDELEFDSVHRVPLWQAIALALLKKYVERYYSFRKREWELPHLEYQQITLEDPNFAGAAEDDAFYRVVLNDSQEEIVAKLQQLREHIDKGDFKPWEFQGLKAIWFDRHLYQPLIYLDKKLVEISPVPLNKGEMRFVQDLKTFHDGNPAFFDKTDLYLLRNMSRGRGVGFFEAGNFHPDFILWLVRDDHQDIAFVDPKGIRNLGSTDPKIRFHETVREIEKRLGDSAVALHSFIVSNTPSHKMMTLWGMSKADLTARNILFQEEDAAAYIGQMLSVIADATKV